MPDLGDFIQFRQLYSILATIFTGDTMQYGDRFSPPRDFAQMGMFWYICHSDTPNCRYPKGSNAYIATRNIKAGEEICADYREFHRGHCHVGDVKLKKNALRIKRKKVMNAFPAPAAVKTEEQMLAELSYMLLGEKIPLDICRASNGEVLSPAGKTIGKRMLKKMVKFRQDLEIDPSPIRNRIRIILQIGAPQI